MLCPGLITASLSGQPCLGRAVAARCAFLAACKVAIEILPRDSPRNRRKIRFYPTDGYHNPTAIYMSIFYIVFHMYIRLCRFAHVKGNLVNY